MVYDALPEGRVSVGHKLVMSVHVGVAPADQMPVDWVPMLQVKLAVFESVNPTLQLNVQTEFWANELTQTIEPLVGADLLEQ